MALKWQIPFPFPIFAPLLNPTPSRPPSEVRFSRWNNANAEKFNERRRAQQEIEDDIRRERRFQSAARISSIDDGTSAAGEKFKSIGTPSFPSRPSIPGRKSKYSKHPYPNPNSDNLHPAFGRFPKTSTKTSRLPKEKKPAIDRPANVVVGEDGLSYVIDGAPFEFKYSYTETPKSKPLKLREAPYAPFGPTTMPRPWTGRAPLPPSKKQMREFDSFRLPPPHKKGVKPVQAPGPFLPGSGPKYVMSREEILGEPLTEEEIMELINGCIKSKRQLNMGRDGLTHNMLDNIHAHWKRRRVCKIKCKGVCTVDMDTVRQQLEERTGGKIIHSKGGVIYLFRGRNYNYRTRPRFPLMLWKPITPVYPRLIKQIPDGLTLEEATEMRKKGRNVIPICKLGKNGVYIDLVKNVREAFEECELVRINCQGMNGSDYRKIGAKLKDLVPCVLISFEREHILMWRGKDWQSSLPKLDQDCKEVMESNSDVDNAASVAPPSLEGHEESPSSDPMVLVKNASCEVPSASKSHIGSDVLGVEESKGLSIIGYVDPLATTDAVSTAEMTNETKTLPNIQSPTDDVLEATMNNSQSVASRLNDPGYVDRSKFFGNITTLDNADIIDGQPSSNMEYETTLLAAESTETKLDSVEASDTDDEKLPVVSELSQGMCNAARSPELCTDGVISLLKQAVEGGSAIILEDSHLDADIVYQKAVAFAESAPAGPVFRHGPRKRKVLFKKAEVSNSEKQDSNEMETKLITVPAPVPIKKEKEKKGYKIRRKDFDGRLDNVVSQGSLGVDELAKLLA